MNQLTTRQSTGISTHITHDRKLSIVLASYQNALTGGMLERDIVSDHRASLQQRLVALHEGLRPAAAMSADKARVARALAVLLSGFANVRGDPQEIIASYTFHLQDLPVFAIEEACKSIARGNVSGLNPDFPPSAPRLHQVAAEACQYWRKEASHIEQVLNAKTRGEITDDERERIGRGLQELANKMRAGEPLCEEPKPTETIEPQEIQLSDALKEKLNEASL